MIEAITISPRDKKRFRDEGRQTWVLRHGKIPAGLVLHHIDGDLTNNVVSNLVVVTPTEHWELHHRGYLAACLSRDSEDIRLHGQACNGINNQNKLGKSNLTGWGLRESTKAKIGKANTGNNPTKERRAQISRQVSGRNNPMFKSGVMALDPITLEIVYEYPNGTTQAIADGFHAGNVSAACRGIYAKINSHGGTNVYKDLIWKYTL